MSTAYIFPGQASQFVGMGRSLCESNKEIGRLFSKADEILGYKLSEIMFDGPEDKIKETIYTQPAVFLHSIAVYRHKNPGHPGAALAGHSLGEITALVVAGSLSFEDGLNLVKVRAEAMQSACEQNPSTMAAILGMEDEKVEEICQNIEGVVVPANYNCPGQLVISGTKEAIQEAIEMCSQNGARRALEISVGGAFHSPLMDPALDSFSNYLAQSDLKDALVPVYQNIDAQPHQDKDVIRENLVKQIISPVRWTSSIQNMHNDGITEFVEVGGKGRVLAGMLRKISRQLEVKSWTEND